MSFENPTASLLPIQPTATFSADRKYRYTLRREFAPSGTQLCFIMLNPSTADECVNDPTVRKCCGYAKRWGFARLVVVNLFALRSTNPIRLYDTDPSPIGDPENLRAIGKSCYESDMVICAWGMHGRLHDRDRQVFNWLTEHWYYPYCLKLTLDGHPCHPLYMLDKISPIPFVKVR